MSLNKVTSVSGQSATATIDVANTNLWYLGGNQSTAGVLDSPERGDSFGAAVSLLNLNGTGGLTR